MLRKSAGRRAIRCNCGNNADFFSEIAGFAAIVSAMAIRQAHNHASALWTGDFRIAARKNAAWFWALLSCGGKESMV
jgi:hypothetical protein